MTEYRQALTELYGLSSRGITPGLDRVRRAVDALCAPSFEVVHVAGTNGKGSVSRMIAEGLDGRVGLFTSPHLHRLLERFQLFGRPPVSETDLVREWAVLRAYLGSPGAPRLSFFEAVTVLALRLFEAAGVEVAVLETGLGGRLDSTNLFERPLVTAITRIAKDHAAWLGEELPTIAREKAGILKPGVPLAMGEQDPEVEVVIRARAQELGAPLLELEDVAGYRLALAGQHQVENARVATTALRSLERQGRAVDLRRALEQVRWPGRLELIEGPPPVLLDAAHNPDGALALARYLETSALPRPRHLLFAAMRDKDWASMLATLEPRMDGVVCTRTPLERSEDPERLANATSGGRVGSFEDACVGAGSVVVAGSLFLVAEVRARLLSIEGDPLIAM